MDFIRESSHSSLIALHCLLGVFPIVSYVMFGMIVTPVQRFVAAVMGSACNFWMVKNISGRKLVGLRWWAECHSGPNSAGNKTWLFEARQSQVAPNNSDAQVFWWTLYALPTIWAILLMSSILSFSLFWSVCAMICLCLHAINLIGYNKCDKDAQQRRAVGISF